MILTLLICAPIAAACLCRLWMLNPQTDKTGWGVQYLLMLTYAMAVFAESANTGAAPDVPSLVALAAIAANLWLTHKQWLQNNGIAPPITRK